VTVKFLPSQVVLVPPPLCGTMESAEREYAAALIVRACQVLGDTWRPVGAVELAEIIKADIEQGREPLTSLNRNPFFRPNYHKLADGKYGRWTGAPGESAIELTEKGIDALERWVPTTPPAVQP
jgi:hypothetical protein